MNKRASVSNVTIGIRYPDGMTETHRIQGSEAEAILNSDRGVTEILAPFYQNKERSLKTAELKAVFGNGVTAITGHDVEVPITPQLIKELWHFRNAGESLVPYIIKIPNCTDGFPQLRSGISLPKTVQARPQVTGITIELHYPDGKTGDITLTEGSFEGLFWSDRAVLEILAPFYHSTERRLSRAEMIDRFGPDIQSVIGNHQSLTINPEFVEKLWNLENDEGLLPPFIIKIPNCTLEIPRQQSVVEQFARRRAA